MIDFSKYRGGYLIVYRKGDLYEYELEQRHTDSFSKFVPFEDIPQEIQERVAILMTAPEHVGIKGVGHSIDGYNFILKDD